MAMEPTGQHSGEDMISALLTTAKPKNLQVTLTSAILSILLAESMEAIKVHILCFVDLLTITMLKLMSTRSSKLSFCEDAEFMINLYQ
mgnify:CR=1 FL=1